MKIVSVTYTSHTLILFITHLHLIVSKRISWLIFLIDIIVVMIMTMMTLACTLNLSKAAFRDMQVFKTITKVKLYTPHTSTPSLPAGGKIRSKVLLVNQHGHGIFQFGFHVDLTFFFFLHFFLMHILLHPSTLSHTHTFVGLNFDLFDIDMFNVQFSSFINCHFDACSLVVNRVNVPNDTTPQQNGFT